MKKIKSSHLIFVAALMLVVVLVWQLFMSLRSHQIQTNADQARIAGKPIPVNTVMAKTGNLNSIIAAECIAKESVQIILSADVGGRITDVSAKVGDQVEKGQLLVKIADEVFKADLKNSREAEYILKKLKSEVQPFISDIRRLRDKGIVPVTDLLDAIERLRRAELDLSRVRKDKIYTIAEIEKTKLTSPISGVLTNLEVEVGTVMKTYENIVTVSRIDPIFLECQFATDMLSAVDDFDSADATFSVYPGDVHAVVLEKILPVVDESTHAVVVQFKLTNKDNLLLPNMLAIVRLTKHVDGVLIPSISLINPRGNSASVFVVDEDQKSYFKTIITGRYAEGYIEVINGLTNGQRVVVVGQNYLQDGDLVNENIVKTTNNRNKTKIFPESSQ